MFTKNEKQQHQKKKKKNNNITLTLEGPKFATT